MKVIDLKIEILKQEIEIVIQRVNHFDDLRHRTQQMAVTLWLAAIGVAITSKSQALIWLASIVPLPFWYFDASYHRYQEGYISRWRAIKDFIQTGKYNVRGDKVALLEESQNGINFGEFPVPDYYGGKTLPSKQHQKETSLFRNLFKNKTWLFYGSLSLIAVLIAKNFSEWHLGG